MFEELLAHVLNVEAGWVNDATDRGKETICGISRVHHPDWEGWKIVDAMKGRNERPQVTDELRAMAKKLYRDKYWSPIRGDQLEIAGKDVALEVFDAAVNLGCYRAGLFLQRSLNLLNRNEVSWPEIMEDGHIGPRTIATVGKAIQGRNGSRDLARVFNAHQEEHHLNDVRKHPAQEKYLRGWLDRSRVA